MKELLSLFDGLLAFGENGNWKMIVMWIIGGVLIYLAIKKEMEPTLLLPIGFGAILMNFPSVVEYFCTACGNEVTYGAFTDKVCNVCGAAGTVTAKFHGVAEPLHELYNAGIAN